MAHCKKQRNNRPLRDAYAPDEFAGRLYAVLLRRLGDPHDAEDLAQEAYLRLLRIERTKLIEKPDAYLFRIATNLANEFAMQQRHALRTVDIDDASQKEALGDGDALERSLESRAEIRRLEAVLDKMPSAYRSVLVLSKRDGLSREEVAKALGLSVHTVKKYLARAAAWCREELSE